MAENVLTSRADVGVEGDADKSRADYYETREVAEKFMVKPQNLKNWKGRNKFQPDAQIDGVNCYLRERIHAILEFAQGRPINAALLNEFGKSYSEERSTDAQIDSEKALVPYEEFEPSIAATLPQLEIEIKQYLQKTAQNIIEVGKRLIAAKNLVQHGNWKNWLDKNFGLKERSAQNFMAIAERFGKTQTFADLKYSQMIELLALPSGDEEKFIEEYAAAGTPVENMTVKNLREEIKEWNNKDSDEHLADAQNPPLIEEEVLTAKVKPTDDSVAQQIKKLKAEIARLEKILDKKRGELNALIAQSDENQGVF